MAGAYSMLKAGDSEQGAGLFRGPTPETGLAKN